MDSQTQSAISKVLADSPSLAKNLAVDQAELISRTAHLGQVGPSIRVDETVMRVLETSIQGFEEVKILYRAGGKPRATRRTVRPLGLLFSRFGYLVASIKGAAPLTFRLDLVQKAELAGTYFEPRPNWDFKEWASESFGIFHGDKLLDVKLRFKDEAARRAERITSHPSQRNEHGRGRTLVVHLRCRGHRELIHELATQIGLVLSSLKSQRALETRWELTVMRLGQLIKAVRSDTPKPYRPRGADMYTYF